MPLFEAVTIELGASIAKSILKVWLKDPSLAADASSSLIDLLKTRTSDALAQRSGRRQFEKIGEMVGENLLPVFESEGAGLDDGSRTAVALAVADAINGLSSDLLAERDLDPAGLAKHLLDTYPPAKQHFNATETELYRRIIQVSCPSIVDIASHLPVFTERTFAEILKRETALTEKADQILQEVSHIRARLGTTDASRFEEDYCKTVARKLNELELFGTDVSNANRRHRLSVAYISLTVEQNNAGMSESDENAYKASEEDAQDRDEEPDRDIVPVEAALAKSRYILISGPAGSGKTTLLQWMAVKSALKSFEGPLANWNNTVPFYIRLRSCLSPDLPKPEELPRLVAPLIADTMPREWVHAQLRSGRAIVLVDGLDEVSTLRREEVRSWLNDLVETFPHAHFIVTSRPHAIEDGWMDHEGFSLSELQPMQLADIYAFIDHWHQAVREELREEEEKAQLAPLAEEMKSDIKRNRPLHNLATSPLLCAMLCALNRDRKQQLPTDRIELYEACCYLLLERRDKERGVDLAEYPPFNYRQKQALLEDLAYWMIKNNLTEAETTLVDERFKRKLKDMQGVAQDSSGLKVRRLFVERSGLIREPAAGRIDFTHRTFEEFLAAKAASDELDTGLLVEKAHNDQWREVIILACGLASRQMREELIKGLVMRGDAEVEYRHRLHLLAIACLETSVGLGEDVRGLVEKRLSKLVPPKNMTEAKALAAAGKSAVKYLSKKFIKIKLPVTTTAACIRTLALIGGDAALEAIEGYADDNRSKVEDELLKAWDYFDRKTYAKQVLARTLRNTSSLRMERLSSLEGFQYFTSLSTLHLSSCEQISDLSPLAGLTQLTTLNLSRCEQISDLSPLAGLTQLTTLNLSSCKLISDLSVLTGLEKLELLFLDKSNANLSIPSRHGEKVGIYMF